jgi:hypothetical protein
VRTCLPDVGTWVCLLRAHLQVKDPRRSDGTTMWVVTAPPLHHSVSRCYWCACTFAHTPRGTLVLPNPSVLWSEKRAASQPHAPRCCPASPDRLSPRTRSKHCPMFWYGRVGGGGGAKGGLREAGRSGDDRHVFHPYVASVTTKKREIP